MGENKVKLTGKESIGFAGQTTVFLGVIGTLVLFSILLKSQLVLGSQFSHLGHPVQIRVVGQMTLVNDLFPEGQVPRVDSDTTVLGSSTGTDIGPVSLLLLHIQTGSVGQPNEGSNETGETEPVDDPKLGVSVNVIVDDGRQEGTEFTHGSRETVSGGSGGDGEHFGGDKEGGAVGAKLLEETGQVVNGLETVNVFRFDEGIVHGSRNQKENKVAQETKGLEPLSSNQLVVNDNGSQVVTDQGYTTVEQVPVPTDNDRVVAGVDDLDECRLEELVTVETKVVGEPTKGSGKDSTTKVGKDQFQRLGVVSRLVDTSILFGPHQRGTRVSKLVVTVVGQPEGRNGHDTELDTESPLSRDGRVGWVTGTVVENEQKNDKDGLVEKLTPTLHQKGEYDVSSSVKLVVTTVD